MSIYDLMQAANKLAEDYIRDNMSEADVKATIGDDRAAYKLWTCNDGVAIRKQDKGRFNYYGGGEYVDKECVSELGDYVFYGAEDSRVAGWLGIDEEVDSADDFNYVGSKHHY